ncbi:AAA family ATPase [Bernardetia sp.]|uniref:AAA family ATPase n=1 Tax=Bernardetia sp. TaxID=1937974 RepID=UPI0025C47CA2|nr:AAA family ATPase [Bernardetia sp.]
MQQQFDYIINLAKEYHHYKENPTALFSAINTLSKSQLESIYEEYADKERNFQPVVLLRAEVARLALEGKAINKEVVEEIKEKIRKKDKNYFSHLTEKLITEMENYGFSKRDIFSNWQQAWTIFHCFFYRGKVKETTQSYLEQIAKDLLLTLDVKDYKFHIVDFQGSANFGSDFCWLGLYPIKNESHRDAYQFFVEFKTKPKAGKMMGSDLKKPHKNDLKNISSYQEIVSCLQSLKQEIITLNEKNRSYYKIAIQDESQWKFYLQGYISMNHEFLGDVLPDYDSLAEIMKDKSRFGEKTHNKRWNLWLFQTAKIGDIVFAAKGVNTCLGIGIIESEILDKTDDMMFNTPNTVYRRVKWITTKKYNHHDNGLGDSIRLFRNDSFSPTKKYKIILEEYIRQYPEISQTFEKYNLPIEIDIVEELNQTKYSEIEVRTNQPKKQKNIKGPKFLRFINPLLQALNEIGGEGKSSEVVQKVIHNMKIPTQELEKKLKSGQIKVKNNIAWARNYLREGGYISNEKHGIWKLTDIGKNKQLTDKEIMLLFKQTQAKYASGKNQEVEERQEENNVELNQNPIYNFKNDKEKPFISEEQFLETVEILKRKKNIILQGAAGVGKTFIARKIAYQIMGETNNLNIEMVQFHQSYSYEDFIQGFRPIKEGFELRDGVFYEFCKKAQVHPKRHFFFIIDEINRGNLSKIFGELMMLIEADKREEKFALKLTYSEDENDNFFVPKNLYLIGTMNTADRSLAMVDYALRRRFAFINLKPDFGESFKDFLMEKGISQGLTNHISSSIQKINQEIASDMNLGEGFQIGHSYFCDYEKEKQDEKDWFEQVIKFEIRPLLEEIWFDNLEKVEEMMEIIRKTDF